jgi:hypothetical protein
MAENEQTPAAPEPTDATTEHTAVIPPEAPAAPSEATVPPGATGAPVTAAPVTAAPVATAPVAAAPAGPRLRDTVWNFRAMLGVAAASLLIGGLGGAGIVALASDDDGGRPERMSNFGGQGPGMRQWNQDGNQGGNRNGPQNGQQNGDVAPGGPGSAS